MQNWLFPEQQQATVVAMVSIKTIHLLFFQDPHNRPQAIPAFRPEPSRFSVFRPRQRLQQTRLPDGIHIGPELRFIHKPEQVTAEHEQVGQLPPGSLDKQGAGQGDPLWQQRDAGVQLLHTQRQPGHGGHQDTLQNAFTADLQEMAALPVFCEGVARVIPVVRQRQSGDGGEFPVHEGNQLAAAGEIADQVTKRGRQVCLDKIAFGFAGGFLLGRDGRIDIPGNVALHLPVLLSVFSQIRKKVKPENYSPETQLQPAMSDESNRRMRKLPNSVFDGGKSRRVMLK